MFWFTNEPFAFLFSVALLVTAVQLIVSFAGFSLLYKLYHYRPYLRLPHPQPPLMTHSGLAAVFLLVTFSIYYLDHKKRVFIYVYL